MEKLDTNKFIGLDKEDKILSIVLEVNDNIKKLEKLDTGKVDIIEGKGLSSKDFTDADKLVIESIKPMLWNNIVTSLSIGPSEKNTGLDLTVSQTIPIDGDQSIQELNIPIAGTNEDGLLSRTYYPWIDEVITRSDKESICNLTSQHLSTIDDLLNRVILLESKMKDL